MTDTVIEYVALVVLVYVTIRLIGHILALLIERFVIRTEDLHETTD